MRAYDGQRPSAACLDPLHDGEYLHTWHSAFKQARPIDMPILVRERPSGRVRQRKQQRWMPREYRPAARQFTGSGQRFATRELNNLRMTIQRLDQRHARIRRSLFEAPAAIAPDTGPLQMLKNQ